MTISFNSIPVTIRTPGQFVEYENSRAVSGLSAIPKKVLVISQRVLTLGTVPDGTAIVVPSVAKAEEYWGHGSLMAGIIETFKAANPYTEVWGVALAEVGDKDIRKITWTHASTAAGTIHIYIGGYHIPVTIASGRAIADIATDCRDAIIAACLATNLPVVATATATETVITALQKGTTGLELDIRLNYAAGEVLPAGVTTSGITNPTPGSGTPVMSVASFGANWFTTFITSINLYTEIDKLETELISRWGPTIKHDGQVFYGYAGSQGTLTTQGNLENSQFLSLIGAGLSPTPPWVWASVFAALDEGEADPARPRQTLVCTGCKAPAPGSEFTWTERNVLLSDGVSTYTVGADGTCYVERIITTYQTNPGGVSDVSYLDITTMRTLAYLRYTLDAWIALRFPRYKLADDGTNFGAGQAIVTPSIIKSECIAVFKQWEEAGLVEGIDQFITDIIVERNSTDVNRVDCRMSPDLMNQFMVFAGQIQFIL